jgi:hypothetical protein
MTTSPGVEFHTVGDAIRLYNMDLGCCILASTK